MATLTSPLTKLLKKFSPNKLELDEKQLQLFNDIKSKLINAPILKLPDHSKVFYLRTDASDTGLGAMLLQTHEDILMLVAYASRLLKSVEINYSVIERELLASVWAALWAVLKFKFYLYGREFIVQSDHSPLTSLNKMKNDNDRLMRWSLSLQPYAYSVDFIKGSDNIGADLLSRSVADS